MKLLVQYWLDFSVFLDIIKWNILQQVLSINSLKLTKSKGSSLWYLEIYFTLLVNYSKRSNPYLALFCPDCNCFKYLLLLLKEWIYFISRVRGVSPLYVHYIHSVPEEARRAFVPLRLGRQMVVNYWEPNLGPLQEQVFLTAEPAPA